MKIENLIFDLDGTLIDSSEGIVEAVNYSLRQMGEPEQKPEAIKSFIGYSLQRMYPHFSQAPLEELYRHFQVKAKETVVAATVKLDGVEDVLNYLRDEGFKMGIATTKIKVHLDKILNKFNWQGYFQVLIGGDEVSRVKPDPEIFHLALQRFGASPESTLVIGDTENDIKGARAVPIKSVGVNSPYGGRDKLKASQPDYFIDNISELPELITKIREGVRL